MPTPKPNKQRRAQVLSPRSQGLKSAEEGFVAPPTGEKKKREKKEKKEGGLGGIVWAWVLFCVWKLWLLLSSAITNTTTSPSSTTTPAITSISSSTTLTNSSHSDPTHVPLPPSPSGSSPGLSGTSSNPSATPPPTDKMRLVVLLGHLDRTTTVFAMTSAAALGAVAFDSLSTNMEPGWPEAVRVVLAVAGVLGMASVLFTYRGAHVALDRGEKERGKNGKVVEDDEKVAPYLGVVYLVASRVLLWVSALAMAVAFLIWVAKMAGMSGGTTWTTGVTGVVLGVLVVAGAVFEIFFGGKK